MPNLVTYQTLTDLSPIQGMRLQWIQIYLSYMYIIALSDFSPIRGTTYCSRIHLIYASLSDLSDANWFESYPRDETAMNSDLFIMYIMLPCHAEVEPGCLLGGGGEQIFDLWPLIFTDTWKYFSYVIPSHQFYQVNGRKCHFQTKFVDIWPWTWNLLLRGNMLPFIYNIPTKCYHHRIFL